LNRFAAEAKAEMEPVSADVRLGWINHDLLVRVKGLSPTQHIEVTLSGNQDDILAEAQLIKAYGGMTQHTLGPIPEPGQRRAIRVVLKDTADGSSRAWAPVREGDLTRPATLWVTASLRDSPAFEIDETDEMWTLRAAEGTSLSVRHRRPALPSSGKGIGQPWHTQAQANTPFQAPPITGWFDLNVVDKDGKHGQSALYWQAPSGEKLSQLGLHPAPKRLAEVDKDPFELSDTSTICAEEDAHRPAAEWLSAELNRLTGHSPDLSCKGPPSIRFIQPDTPFENPEGFEVNARKKQLTIRSTGRRASFYGAMTAADLIGFDNSAKAVDIEDWPRIKQRVLFHEVNPHNGPMVSPDQVQSFIEKVVARGRFNMLVLEMKSGLKYASHPELSRRDAWTSEQLQSVLNTARHFGIEVIPALNSPAHSQWIGKAHPQLLEDETATLLCTQNPETRKLISDLYSELWALYDQPRFIHIGHDEIGWRTRHKHETQRCVRCQGTPRWQLLTEDLLWHHKTLKELGAKPMLWSDMLVKGWHGKQGGMFRASNRIDPALRPDFVVMSWGRTGDTIGELVPKGYTVIRGNTGYADWKRPGLNDIADGVAGEALALFNPIPWSSFEGTAGNTRLYHHWSNAILAGATAWEPKIETTPIDTALLHVAHLPPYLPGYRAWPKPNKLGRFRIRTEPRVDQPLKVPEVFDIGSMRYSSGVLFQVDTSESKSFLFSKYVYGISLVQAVSYGPTSQTVLSQAHHKTKHQMGVTVAKLRVTYKDGDTLNFPMVLGLNTTRADAPVRGSLLFDSSGTVRMPNGTTAEYDGNVPERSLYRSDWINPRPEAQLATIEFEATHPDVTWTVAGIGYALTPAKDEEDD